MLSGISHTGSLQAQGQSNRDVSIIFRSCESCQPPVYPIRDAFAVVDHPTCPSSSPSRPLPLG